MKYISYQTKARWQCTLSDCCLTQLFFSYIMARKKYDDEVRFLLDQHAFCSASSLKPLFVDRPLTRFTLSTIFYRQDWTCVTQLTKSTWLMFLIQAYWLRKCTKITLTLTLTIKCKKERKKRILQIQNVNSVDPDGNGNNN